MLRSVVVWDLTFAFVFAVIAIAALAYYQVGSISAPWAGLVSLSCGVGAIRHVLLACRSNDEW